MAVVFLVGFVVVLIGVAMLMRAEHLKKVCTGRADGEVVDLIQKTSQTTEHDKETGRTTTETRTMFYPMYRYEANGQAVIRQSSTGTSSPRFAKGQRVTICFNPDRVEQYYVAEDKAFSRFGIIVIVMGVLVMVAGFFVS